MSIAELQSSVVEEFRQFDDWADKYKHLIELGRKLTDMSEDMKTDANKVKGCQSQVWMHAELKGGKMVIMADSDAAIVRGLVALLLRVYSNQSPAEIMSNEPKFLEELGLNSHLSQSRTNGLVSMIKQIKMYAFAFNAMEK
jgi:cysteine desulfuration protein SufE